VFLLMKLVSIKQLEDPESVKVEYRVSGETEVEGENRFGWETEVLESESKLEPGAYSLEVENRPSLEPEEIDEGNNDTGTDKQ
jgi:hypothetical protein